MKVFGFKKFVCIAAVIASLVATLSYVAWSPTQTYSAEKVESHSDEKLDENKSLANELNSCVTEPPESMQLNVLEENLGVEINPPTEVELNDVVVEYNIMYTTTNLNVRTGPGVEHKKLGVLGTGETVRQVEAHADGWSEVLYNGEQAYVCTKYLAETKPADKEEKVVVSADKNSTASTSCSGNSNPDAPYVGNFNIPSVGVNVNCYETKSQATVDASNSAAYFYNSGHDVIADHVNQGFSGIKSCSVGTKANFGDKEYTCVGSIQGHNTKTALTDADYNSIEDLYPGALVCYTCNDGPRNVTIVFFMPDDNKSDNVQASKPQEETKKAEPNEENMQAETNPLPDEKYEEIVICEHVWGDLEFTHETTDEALNARYGWGVQSCTLCDMERTDLCYVDSIVPFHAPAPVEEESVELGQESTDEHNEALVETAECDRN